MNARMALSVCLAALAGCADKNEPTPSFADVQSPAERAKAAGVDGRDQYALLDAIVEAKGPKLGHDPGILARVRGEWIDQRFRWDVRLQPALCRAIGDCTVLPFDHATREEPIAQGWLPRMDLSREQRAALVTRCTEHRRCVITFEGTLSQFELSTEHPTSLTFSDIDIVATRDAAPTESWTVSKRRSAMAKVAEAAVRRRP